MPQTQPAHSGFIVDSDLVNVALLAPNFRAVFSNPTGSGKKIIIDSFVFVNSISAIIYAKIYRNPTTTLSSSAVTAQPITLDGTAQASVGVFKYDTNAVALSGGTRIVTTPLKGSDRTVFDEKPMSLMPGQSIGININAGVAIDALVVIYYREEPIN